MAVLVMPRPIAPIALTGASYDRVAERREDDTWLHPAWAQGRVLTLAGSKVLAPGGTVAWLPAAEVEGLSGTRVLLGQTDARASFALLRPAGEAGSDDWLPLRALATSLAEDDAPYVVHAVGLAEWHLATRCCPRCGGSLTDVQSGHQKRCTECGKPQFPRCDPAVIMLVVDGEDRALLGRQRAWPENRFSTLAGFVEPGESLEDAVRREVFEEAGVQVGEVTYYGSQPWPLPSSLMVGFHARAESTTIREDGEELAEGRWFTRQEMADQAQSGEIQLPGAVSISRSLIESWYGAALPGEWR